MRSFPYAPRQFGTECFDQPDNCEPVVAALAEDEHHACAVGPGALGRLSHSGVLAGHAAQRTREPKFAQAGF